MIAEWREEPVSPRASLLNNAEALVTQDRNKTHGEPTENFQHIADLWNVLLADKLAPGADIDRGDVARLMVATKLARMRAGAKKDHWADIAGYAACGFECDTADGKINE